MPLGGITSVPQQAQAQVQANGSTSLTSDQFMKLLLTQIKNQDPLSPISDADFAAQLAQFSSLEGINQLNANFSDMLFLQQLTQGANLVGRNVTYQPATGSTTKSGVVQSVNVQNGKLQLLVNGTPIPLSSVRSVAQS